VEGRIPDIFFPVVLDLDGDGVELTALDESSVFFDVDGDGAQEHTGWVSPDDGLLVLDRNGDGVVNDGSEISFVDDKVGARTDLEGLTAFDSNGDGALNAADERFDEFRVWQDLDQDGETDAGELDALSELDIVSLDLQGVLETPGEGLERVTVLEERDGNLIFGTTTYTQGDGAEGVAADVGLLSEDLGPRSVRIDGRSDVEFEQADGLATVAKRAVADSPTDVGEARGETGIDDGGPPNDRRLFGDDVAPEDLWFRQDGDALQVNAYDTADRLASNSRSGDEANGVKAAQSSLGERLLQSQVDQLVTAMSAFDPTKGESTLTYDDPAREQVQTTIAENLQT